MNKKSKILKIILINFILILFIIGIFYMLPVIKNLTKPEGQVAFKNKIEKTGFLGMLSLFGLQVAQIFLIIVPGEPIEVLAGMCYGCIGGLTFITISVAIITTMIIFLVRKFGRKFVYEFCKKERIEKIENSKIFKDTKELEWIMIVLFLIPGTPKDLLVYIAGLLPINPYRFILISTLARFPSIISSTLAGEHLVMGNWQGSIMVYAVTFLLVGIILLLINLFDKNKTTGEIIKNIHQDLK